MDFILTEWMVDCLGIEISQQCQEVVIVIRDWLWFNLTFTIPESREHNDVLGKATAMCDMSAYNIREKD